MGMFALNKNKKRGEANLQIIGEAKFDPEHFFVFFDGFAQGFCLDFNAVINFGSRKKDQIKFTSKAFGSVLEKMFHREYDVYGAIESFD